MMSSMRGVTKRIQAIKFALLSPDEIRRISSGLNRANLIAWIRFVTPLMEGIIACPPAADA